MLESNVLISLYHLYLQSLSDAEREQAIQQVAFNDVITEIEQQLPEYFDWQQLAEQPTLTEPLQDLLHASIVFSLNSGDYEYDALACQYACMPLSQQFKHASQLRLLSPSHEQGIQEAFLKSNPYQSRPLTLLDIERHIVQTHMVGQIGLVKADAEDIGLYLAHANHKLNQSSSALMLNLGTDEAPIWSSVVISLNKATSQMNYQVTSSPALTLMQQQQLKQVIEQGIGYSKASDKMIRPISAYPALTIAEPTFEAIEGGAYKVLHHLYQQPALAVAIEERVAAQQFKETEDDLDSIQQAIVDRQILSIKITPEVFNLFDDTAQPQHPLVNEVAQDVRLTDRKITFPSVLPATPLTAQDYQAFILLLNAKFSDDTVALNLNQLALNCPDSAALQGLARLKFDNIGKVPFEQLTLNLPTSELSAEQKAQFKFNLKLALVSMSDLNLQKLQLNDEAGLFNEADIAEIATFIAKNQIAIDLTLPSAFINSAYQCDIDMASSDALLARKQQQYQEAEKVIKPTTVDRPVRTRPQIASQNLSIDVELQQEVQVEVAVDASSEVAQAYGDDAGEAQLYRFNDFYRALIAGEFSDDSKSYLMTSHFGAAQEQWNNWFGNFNQTHAISGMRASKAALEEIMRHQDGFQYGIGFIKRDSQYTNLPAGFRVKGHGDEAYLDFDPKLKLITEPSLLAVDTADIDQPFQVGSAMVAAWLEQHPQHPFAAVWQAVINDGHYDRSRLIALQQALPTIDAMPEEQVARLFELAQKEERLDPARLKFLTDDAKAAASLASNERQGLAKHIETLFGAENVKAVTDFLSHYQLPNLSQGSEVLKNTLSEADYQNVINIAKKLGDVNHAGLLQLYGQSGVEGLKDLSDLLANADDEQLTAYQQLNQWLFTKDGNYQQILSSDFQDAFDQLKALPSHEQTLFMTLLPQHAEHHNSTSFAKQFNAFIDFKKQLAELSQPDSPLVLPEQCSLTGVKSLPLALARMVALVRHAKEQDRQAQLNEAAKLDLSSCGAINAITTDYDRGKMWHFIAADMNVSMQHEYDLNRHQAYMAPSHWRGIRPMAGAGYSEDFLRYAAHQLAKGSLSMAFYQHVDQKIKNSDWSDENKRLAYQLIAASSVGPESTAFVDNEQQAMASFDQFFEKINNPPNPGFVTSMLGKDPIRNALLADLVRLENLPPLPVLSKLVSLIASSLSTGLSVARNRPKLISANQSLNEMSSKYGIELYKGMLNYREEDYANGGLFFEHMHTIEAIDQAADFTNPPARVGPAEGMCLLQLISAFHLNSDKGNLEQVLLVFDEQANMPYEKQAIRAEVFIMLTSIDTEKYQDLPALSHQDLVTILNNIEHYGSALELIKNTELHGHKLAEYFDARYIENYGKTAVPREVKQKIKSHFNEAVRPVVENVLLRFMDNEDANQYGEVVDKLVAICQKMPLLERNLFIQKLSQSHGLYSNVTKLNAPDNVFMALLNQLDGQQAIDDFLNFLASDQLLYQNLQQEGELDLFYSGEPKCNQGLDKKALMFLRDIYPALKHDKSLPLTNIEIISRAHQLVLRTPVNQLAESSAVVNLKSEPVRAVIANAQSLLSAIAEGDKPVVHLIDELSEKVNDIDGDENYPNKDGISELAEKLDGAKAPVRMLPEEAMAILSNPSAHQIINYFSGNLSESDREKFERQHGDFLKSGLEKHPLLLQKQDLIKVLFVLPDNLNLLKNVLQGDSLAALQSDDLLEDEQKFDSLLSALDSDVLLLDELKESVSANRHQAQSYVDELSQYPATIQYLFSKLGNVIKDNASAKAQLLTLLDKFISQYQPEQGEMMLTIHHFIDVISDTFSNIKDKNIVLSLCMHFNGEDELLPTDLIELIDTVNQVSSQENKSLLIKVAADFLNNEKGYQLESSDDYNFSHLCQLVESDSRFAGVLQQFYSAPPYPSLSQIIEVHQTACQSADYQSAVNQQFEVFDKKPCHRELEVNGFHVDRALEQLPKFAGYQAGEDKLHRFADKVASMRALSSQQLLDLLQTFHCDNPEQNQDMETLVAVAAELFYRSKGKDELNEDGVPKLGSSMEINTTQYLAILSSLETKGHVTSQIGTGEGKSRIMMISNVCQWALGNTVDFVTSDAQLATRDYVEYQAYFNMVGAETSMIFANSDPASYKIGGINFSDPSNLSLFRNKATSLGKRGQVIDGDASRRALMLDEADKTYFDVADTRFNFSKEGDEALQEMGWVYPLLMAYFEQQSVNVGHHIDESGAISPMTLFYKDVDASRESFLAFAGGQCSRADFLRLKSLSAQQIEQWQVSAVTASQLEFNKDFVIAPDQLIATNKGAKIASEAQLLFANRVASGSKFSFGVHQCLHARLNRLRQSPQTIADAALRSALSDCEKAFHIEDEKQIVYSSTSKNLIDDYREGTLKAVTGTAGSVIERVEAHQLYNDMQFIDVPRAKGMNRIDKGIQLEKDEHAQLKRLIQQIQEAQAKNQPILVIAENDEESAKLYQLLQQNFSEDIQRIDSQLSSKEESKRTRLAGLPRMITVSTDMIGRGTDIALRDRTLANGDVVSAKDHGLNVMVTYLPKVRDLQQIVGRSGRFGANGETSLVIDKARLLKRIGRDKLPKGFEQNINRFIANEQMKMDRKSQVERLIKNHVGDFRMQLEQNFFEQMLTQVAPTDRSELIACWTAFFEKSDKAWNEVWPEIQQQLHQPNITETELTAINEKLADYRQTVQKEWQGMTAKIRDKEISCLDGETKAEDNLFKAEELPSLQLNQKVNRLFTGFKRLKQLMQAGDGYKIGLGTGLGILGVAIGGALTATGILAPLGLGLIATAAAACAGGAAVGAAAGIAAGAVIDKAVRPDEVESIDASELEQSEALPMADEALSDPVVDAPLRRSTAMILDQHGFDVGVSESNDAEFEPVLDATAEAGLAVEAGGQAKVADPNTGAEPVANADNMEAEHATTTFKR